MDHVLIIERYLDTLGGRLLIGKMRSHYLQCTLSTESTQQIWREFYNYQNNVFNISVELNNRSLMKIEGNRKYGVKRQGKVEHSLSQEELSSLHMSIQLVPELEFLNPGFGTQGIEVKESKNDYRIKLFLAPFGYELCFDKISCLKKEVIIENINQEDSKLVLKYSDWRVVDGLYYPFFQEMSGKHLLSYRSVDQLVLKWA